MNITLGGLLFVSLVGRITGCHREFYGTDCDFRCHCRQDGHCDPSSGDCGSVGCAGGWMGLSCQYENIAYNKQTSGAFYEHQYAVDGRKDTYAYELLSENTQMSINLGESFTVERLLVHGRSDRPLGNFLVYVGTSQDYTLNSLCYNYTGNDIFVDIKCERKLNGTYLHLVFLFTGTGQSVYLYEVEVYRGPCPRGTFGPICNFKCRCQSDDHCNQMTGECSDQCKPGWMGPSCQYGNIAYRSSTFGALYGGDRIADGSKSPCAYRNNADDIDASINLGGSFVVRRLLIHVDVDNTFGHFLVYVGSQSDYISNNLCYNYTQNEMIKVVDVMCEKELEGAYIHVVFPGTNRYVNLCEIEVYGGQDVAYRKQTDQLTNLKGLFGSGRAVDGDSDKTSDGDSCMHTEHVANPWWKVELNGTFIISWMKLFNRDHDHDRIDGFRVDITHSGQRDTVFTDNVPGYPSDEIRFPVSPHRVGEIVTVLIPRRAYLTLCEVEVYAECMGGSFGIGCLTKCNCDDSTEVCDGIDGGCAGGCKTGYQGNGCQFVCKTGTFGFGCGETCSHCVNGSCHHADGKCTTTCEIGYRGLSCNDVCKTGTFGFGCSETCSHCVNGSCHHADGKCTTTCEIGYRGLSCNDECAAGTFGQACSQSCGQCENGECHHKNGSCLSGCKIGYVGDRCKGECPSGKYGMHCESNCSSNCVDTLCNYFSGHCLSGCIGGYHGEKCTLVSPDSDKTVTVIGTAVGGVLAVIVIVVVIVVIFCCGKRNGKQNTTDTQMQTVFSSADSEGIHRNRTQNSIKTSMDGSPDNKSSHETVTKGQKNKPCVRAMPKFQEKEPCYENVSQGRENESCYETLAEDQENESCYANGEENEPSYEPLAKGRDDTSCYDTLAKPQPNETLALDNMIKSKTKDKRKELDTNNESYCNIQNCEGYYNFD